MLRKLSIAGAIAGVALGSALVAAPAFAGGYGHHHGGGDEQVNVNVQSGSAVCNSDSAEGVIAVNIPLLNHDRTGDCGSSPVTDNS